MATELVLVDDLNGSRTNVSTVTFAIDGKEYQIDLGKSNANQLRRLFQPYIEVARKAGSNGGKTRRAPAANTASGTHPGEGPKVREWMREHGVPVSNHGRLPRKYIAAYRAGDTSVFEQPAPADTQPDTATPVVEDAA